MYLKKMVNDPQIWTSFEEYIHERMRARATSCIVAKEEFSIRKHQGAYEELSKLLKLKEELNLRDKKDKDDRPK